MGSSGQPSTLVVLANRLLRHTKAGKLNWETRAMRPHALEVDLESGNVEVGTVDDDGAPPYDLKVFSRAEDGAYRLIESISTRDTEMPAELLTELWSLVRRQALGVDATLKGLLDELGDDEARSYAPQILA